MQTTNTKSLEYNLVVLKKHDKRITRVLHTAGHAVVYVYKEDAPGGSPWERHNVEGALFIVERDCEPKYQLLILNRLSTDNLVENINPQFSIEVSEDFLLYKNDEGEVLGLWFYNSVDRDSVARLIEGLVEQVSLQAQATEMPSPAPAVVAADGTTSSVDAFFAAARGAAPPSPAAAPQAAPGGQALSAEAIGLLSKLQVGGANVGAAGVAPAPTPAVAPTSTPAGGVLDSSLREALRRALARIVNEERFIEMVEEEYVKLTVTASPPPPPAAAPQPAAPAASVEPVDPKDGNALLKSLLQGLKP